LLTRFFFFRFQNITKVQVTESRVFALSASGKVYVIPAAQGSQSRCAVDAVERAVVGHGLVVGRGNGSTARRDRASAKTRVGREVSIAIFSFLFNAGRFLAVRRITSIAAGSDHLLALTSSGRTFVHPITKNANTHGQLGFRKFDIPDPSSTTAVARLDVELTPRAIADPYAKSSRYARDPSPSAAPVDADDTALKYSDRFFEVPALRDVRVIQIAAGARSSFVRTDTERVLGWGANDYGCVYLPLSASGVIIVTHDDDRTDKLVWAGMSRLTRSLFPRKLSCGGVLRVAHVRDAST
jgi:alpha-tubulin suppressor-like RCC1 family protein